MSRNTRKESVILPNAALFFPPGAKTLPKDDRIAPEYPIHPFVTASLCDSRNVRCLRRTRQAALSLTARVTSSTGLLSWTFLLWKRRRRSLSDPGNATPGRHLGEITRPNARRSSLPKYQLRFLPNREAGVDASFFTQIYIFYLFLFFLSYFEEDVVFYPLPFVPDGAMVPSILTPFTHSCGPARNAPFHPTPAGRTMPRLTIR